jgi:phage baseplate assembly protein W
MARYTDLDLTFIPNPSAHDRTPGIGTISFFDGSSIVTGNTTDFTRYLNVDYNLYVTNTFIGKIKSIESDTSLTLYSPAKLTGSTDIYDNYIVPDSSVANIVRSTFTDLSTDFQFNVFSSASGSEGSNIRFDIYTNYPLFVDTEKSNRLSLFDDPYIPVQYSIKGIDTFDVAGEYDRNDPFVINISDTLNGILTFNVSVDYPDDGFYHAFIELQTTIDNEVEVMERAVIEFYIDGITLASSNNNFTYAKPADVSIKTDINAIKTAIKHIVLTSKFERPYNARFGTNVSNMFFEFSSAYSMMVKRSIEIAISEYEPRVTLNNVTVTTTEYNEAIVTITFTMINTDVPYTFNLTLERTR